MTNTIAWSAMIFWGHNAKPFQLLLNKEVGQQSWNVTFSHSNWKVRNLLMIVCWLFDSGITNLNLKWNPNYIETKLEVRWDGGIWRYRNICTAMTNLVYQFWLSKVKNSPRRSLKGCCMVRLLTVLALAHLVVWINTALCCLCEWQRGI